MSSDTRVGAADHPTRRMSFGRRLAAFFIAVVLLLIVAVFGLVLWTHHRFDSEVAIIRAAGEPLTWDEFIAGGETSGAGREYARAFDQIQEMQVRWQQRQSDEIRAKQRALDTRMDALEERLAESEEPFALETAIGRELGEEMDALAAQQDVSSPFEELLKAASEVRYDVSRLSDTQWSEAKALVSLYGDALAQLSNAATIDGCNFRPNLPPQEVEAWYPVRVAGELLMLEGLVQLHQGRHEHAAEVVVALVKLRRVTDGQRTMMAHLIDRSLTASAAFILVEVLPDLPDDSAWFDRFARLLAEAYDPQQFTRMLAAERAQTYSMMERVQDGTGTDFDRWSLGWEGVPSPLMRLQAAEALADFGKIVSASKAVFPQMLAMQPAPRGVMERMVFIHLETLPHAEARAVALIRATHLAIAADRFRRVHGRFPTSLPELTPANPALDLSDPFTGKAMLLRATDTGLNIYSVGDDLRDDGGRLHQNALAGDVDFGTHLRTP